MANKRHLPFGYRLMSGEIVINCAEADCIQHIFDQYVEGNSISDIAAQMQQSGICYHDGRSAWNKQMIKRILENHKYLGEKVYQQIIAKELFDRVQRLRESKINPNFKRKPNVESDIYLPPQKTKAMPNISIIRLENQINSELSHPVADADQMQNRIIELARLKYEFCLAQL